MLVAALSLAFVLGASVVVGQAIYALAGTRAVSPLAPAVGLSALLALAWATVRLPGEGTAAAIALGVVTLASGVVTARAADGLREGLRAWAPVAVAAILLATLPFIVEARFGILGTGLNPDMSQHLLAADRLAGGGEERLIADGYPLGPHALVVALSALGLGLVQAFDGLMVTIAVAICLAAFAALEGLPGWKRSAGALVAGFAYLLASNHTQGAFKESLEAMIVLAFAVALVEIAGAGRREEGAWRQMGADGTISRQPRAAEANRASALRALPLAVLAVGAVYAYSFPGLAWLVGALVIWVAVELGLAARSGSPAGAAQLARRAVVPAGVGVGVFLAAVAPEIGRMISFAGFETFDPDGAGLGNLFNRLSPLEALGVWPSGDFRVEPGDGAVPAPLFYLGAALGAGALALGLRRSLDPDRRPLLAALAAAAVLWVYALLAGTPYQEAKALLIAAPLIAVIAVRGLLSFASPLPGLAYLAAAGGSAVLALANGPVGPSGYSAELAELRGELGSRSTVVYAPERLLDDHHGRDYLVWELRGNRICVEGIPREAGIEAPAGASLLTVGLDDDGAVVPEGLYRIPSRPPRGSEPCPFIADGARADPAGDD